MTLCQTIRDIITHVEEVSGLPVQVLQDATLPTLASVQMARGNMTAHIVRYRPGMRFGRFLLLSAVDAFEAFAILLRWCARDAKGLAPHLIFHNQ